MLIDGTAESVLSPVLKGCFFEIRMADHAPGKFGIPNDLQT
jgi:hypothetical protein